MSRETLLHYPYVTFRLACRYCARVGAYRLVRLAVKFGCEADVRRDGAPGGGLSPLETKQALARRGAASICPTSSRRVRCPTTPARGPSAWSKAGKHGGTN